MTTQNLDGLYAKTCLLLALWDMDGLGMAVKKSDLTSRVLRTKEKVGDYNIHLDALAEAGAIALTNKAGKAIEKTIKAGTLVMLTAAGKVALSEGLADPNFMFGGQQVGSKMANSLLKWIREFGSVSTVVSDDLPKISSYAQFKSVALETYDQLNRDYNFDNLVPIYRIRRAIGDRVTRLQFSDWLLEMQANDILQLQTTGIEDNAPDKLEDSIITKVSGLRCYAKRIN